MACSEDVAGTLRAQEHGHQPLIVDKRSDEMMPALYENHGIDARYGYYVMIDHGNGLSTLYGHNSRLLAQVGQTVEAGDIVALSGSTGRSTGPHLHFEVRVNGERTNPRFYLPTTGG